MIVTANKMAVIEDWNENKPGKIELLAMACMWEARATIVNALAGPAKLIDIEAVKAENFVKAEMARTNYWFSLALNQRPADVYQQMLLLPEY